MNTPIIWASCVVCYPISRFGKTRVIGGGARSRLWNQIKADILGVPYVTRNREEFGVLGSAILAGYAVGVFDDLADTAQRLTQATDRIEPDQGKQKIYQPLVREYINLFDLTRPVFDGSPQYLSRRRGPGERRRVGEKAFDLAGLRTY